LFLPAVAPAAPWRIVPLQTLGGPRSEANGVNNAGQVVGRAADASGGVRAVLWEPDGRVRDLGVLPGGAYSVARRINSSGQVVGLSHTAAGQEHATLWDTAGITDIGTLGGRRSFAQDVSDLGVVVGSSDADRGSRAFTWTRTGGFVDYGNFNTADPQLNAGFNSVNSAGLAVGTAFRLLEPFRAVVADPDKQGLIDYGPPGRTLSMANGVNDHGVIVGFASRGNTPEHAVIFHGPNDFTELPTLGLDESWAEDVNNAGDIVGSSFDPSIGFRPFLYRGGQMLDLTRLLPEGSGWDELIYANNINDRGVIVGAGRYRGVLTGFVMSQVPEPAASGFLAVAAVGLTRAGRRRRR
jgi:probable HAF family extracellular repeat protein